MLLTLAAATLVLGADTPANWDPNSFRNDSTLQIMTTGQNEGEHWSYLWLVVIDGQLYVRLGTRAYDRIQNNTTTPYVKLRAGGQEYDRVRVDQLPDMKAKVAAAMADKYWMDVLVRHENHPMVARLTPEVSPTTK